ncbi:MAG: PQQ-binding-like beta-propeller repeat protein [Opitutales bacterium]
MEKRLKGVVACCLSLLGFISPGQAEDDNINWPSFRGTHAAGVSEGPALPEKFDGRTGKGLTFKVEIPGLAHSSPIVWSNLLFLTTAISSETDASFKPGLYGAGEASKDRTIHEWLIMCYDKRTGKLLWKKTATKGRSKDKRHVKATYANSTPATDGKHVVAFFGSEGLFAYTVEGDFLWKKDLGRLDVGAYDLPSYEWGSASSPVIHEGKVIVQCDTQSESFLTALDLRTGRTLWTTPRDELPSWGTPTVVTSKKRTQVVANGSNFIRGYEFETGKELWRLGGSSKITAPTPVFEAGLIVVASGRAPERPIFAIREDALGDLTLNPGKTKNEFVAWSHVKRGPYMPTPLIYREKVYLLHNGGIFACYDLKSGNELSRSRIPHKAFGFSASPVATNGKIYLSGEDGLVFEMKAGDEPTLLAVHEMGELLMASPALSEGVMYLRGQRHLFAVGKHK